MMGGKSSNCILSVSLIQKNADLLRSVFLSELQWVDDRDYSYPRCPVCLSDNVCKNGHCFTGRQRFLCIDCRKTYTNQNTISRLKYTKLTMDVWRKFLECQVSGLSIRDSAKICDVSIPTAYRMRSCLLSIIDNLEDD